MVLGTFSLLGSSVLDHETTVRRQYSATTAAIWSGTCSQSPATCGCTHQVASSQPELRSRRRPALGPIAILAVQAKQPDGKRRENRPMSAASSTTSLAAPSALAHAQESFEHQRHP